MAEKRTNTDGDDQLKGGTQGGGGARNVQVDPPAGVSQPDQGPASPPGGAPPQSGGTRNDAQTDPEDIFEGSRKRSQSEAKQRARDEADAPTQPRTPHGAGEPRHHQIEPTE
jgi:hypothetical protein